MIDAASIARAHGGRPTGNGFLCQCPVSTHGRGRGDRNPSLSISKGDDGKLLVHCHAGCAPRDVLSALGYYDEGDCQSPTNDEIFFRSAKPNGTQSAPDSEAKRFFDGHLIKGGYTFVCAYDYTTEDGEVLYQVCRYERSDNPKEFLQRRPDGQGGWFGGAGTRKVLYRWPDLKKAAHDTVFVCEGEKDADRLASLDFIAVTVASGSWSEEAIRALAGYHCFILEDNDKPGHDKAQKAAAALHGVAASVHIVRLPGLGEGEDVSNWLDQDGGRSSRLVDIAMTAPEWEPPQQQDEFTQTEAPPTIAATPFLWIDPATIPLRQFVYGRHYIRQFVSTTVAPGGVGKSSLGIAEALAIASGKALLGVQPEGRSRVWLWNGEDPIEELQRRVMATALHYKLTREDLEGYLFLDSGRRMPVVIAEQTRDGAKIAVPVVEAVTATIRENKIDVASIDPFAHRIASPKTTTTQSKESPRLGPASRTKLI